MLGKCRTSVACVFGTMSCDKYHRSFFHFFVRAREKTFSHEAEGEIFLSVTDH